MFNVNKIFVFIVFFSFSVFFSCPADEKDSPGNVNPRTDFMRGFDASIVSQIEENGGIYRTASGSEKDVFEILKENGVNWIRLRLWHSPDAKKSAGDNTLQRTVQIAKRIKENNLSFLLDIHYSDTWADPASQKRPAAWDSCATTEELTAKVSEYTAEILEALKDFQPDMIQIGNEINPGMLVTKSGADSIEDFAKPCCSSWKSEESAENLGEILNAAAKSIRKFNPDIKIMIHLSSKNGDNLEWWFRKFIVLKDGNPSDRIISSDLDFDYIGLSYYPFYDHGTLDSLKSNIQNLKEKTGKQVLVAETSWAWTDGWSDETPNLFGDDQKIQGAKNLKNYISKIKTKESTRKAARNVRPEQIDATPETQAAVLKVIFNAVAESGGCGLFYWGGDWIPAKNIQNNWENQAMFDFSGKALPALKVFKQMN